MTKTISLFTCILIGLTLVLTRLHYGVIAQQLEEVLPDAVTEVNRPAKYDDEGELIGEAVSFKSVNYTELIPILIKATQEQQELIDQQAAQINDLMDVVSACCSADTKSNETEDFNIFMDVKETALDQNYPNPFQRTTTISYTVGCACEAQVVILDQAGRIIETFNNGAKEAGDYQFQWDASNLESWIYFYSLIVDGQEYVKRALKL